MNHCTPESATSEQKPHEPVLTKVTTDLKTLDVGSEIHQTFWFSIFQSYKKVTKEKFIPQRCWIPETDRSEANLLIGTSTTEVLETGISNREFFY